MSEKKDIMEEVYKFVESSLPSPDITVNVEKRIAKRADSVCNPNPSSKA